MGGRGAARPRGRTARGLGNQWHPREASHQESWLDSPGRSGNARILAGAGGRWRTIGEVVDPSVVQQYTPVACGAACGVMVLRDRGIDVDQQLVGDEAGGVPVFEKALAAALTTLDTSGGVWRGGMIEIAGAPRSGIVGALNGTGSWIAFMREPRATLGHTVIVDGLDTEGHVRVRDPWDGTRYTMTMRSFLQYWTGTAVYRG